MGLPVPETSSKEACEGRDIVEVGGDGVGPHQILHTEIVEPFIKGKAGHSTLKDMLRGGIWFTAVPAIIPRAGRLSPNVGIGRGVTRVANVRRIIMRDVIEVANIAAGAGRHVLLLVSDEGDDGIISPNHHPLYNLSLGPRRHHSLSVNPSARRV